jgi:hypothetical protein
MYSAAAAEWGDLNTALLLEPKQKQVLIALLPRGSIQTSRLIWSIFLRTTVTSPVRQAIFFLAYKPAVADLLWEKNTVPRLISRADKLSRTGDTFTWLPGRSCESVLSSSHNTWSSSFLCLYQISCYSHFQCIFRFFNTSISLSSSYFLCTTYFLLLNFRGQS